jgi:tetratricopeptide (TPR) repeat protein
LEEAARLNREGYPAPLAAWLPHLHVVAESAAERDGSAAGALFNGRGYHLTMVADLTGAQEAYERALEIDEGAFGPDHPNVAIHVNHLGSVYETQGRLEEAREAYERALEIDEGAFGPDHPEVAVDVNNLGSVYQDQGRLEEAREAFERALGIFERFLGPDHPSTRTVKANLESLVEEAQS